MPYFASLIPRPQQFAEVLVAAAAQLCSVTVPGERLHPSWSDRRQWGAKPNKIEGQL